MLAHVRPGKDPRLTRVNEPQKEGGTTVRGHCRLTVSPARASMMLVIPRIAHLADRARSECARPMRAMEITPATSPGRVQSGLRDEKRAVRLSENETP